MTRYLHLFGRHIIGTEKMWLKHVSVQRATSKHGGAYQSPTVCWWTIASSRLLWMVSGTIELAAIAKKPR